MTDTPEYETKTFDLPKGIKLGGIIYKLVVIRELTVGDIVSASSGQTADERIFKQVARRVMTLGSIDNPGEGLIEKLSIQDFTFIEQAMEEMDKSQEGDMGKKQK